MPKTKNPLKKIYYFIIRQMFKYPELDVWVAKHFLRTYVKWFYFNWLGRFPNIKNPADANELLLSISLKNKGNKLIVDCADKYKVREYIQNLGYANILNDMYGVYDRFEDINFSALPDLFVLKMNNASGRNYICKNKKDIDMGLLQQNFSTWLKDRNFGLLTGEWQYSMIEPKIVVEKYLENLGEETLIDYKFQCFKGHIYSCFVGYNRSVSDPHGKVCFDDYTLEWERTERIKASWHKNRRLIPKPDNFDEMVKIASRLCKSFDYVRVDLYNINGKILFGELTFTPHGCVPEYYTQEALQDMKAFYDDIVKLG